MSLKDYDAESVMGMVVFYTLTPFYNHSRTQYRRKYKGSLNCGYKPLANALGWIYIKTGLYLYD